MVKKNSSTLFADKNPENTAITNIIKFAQDMLGSIQSQWTSINETDMDELNEFIYSNATQPLPNTLAVENEEEQKNIDFFFHLIIANAMMSGSERVLAELFFYRLWQHALQTPGLDIARMQLIQATYEDEGNHYTFAPMVVIYHNQNVDPQTATDKDCTVIKVDAKSTEHPKVGSDIVQELFQEADIEYIVTVDDVMNSKPLFDSFNNRLNPLVEEIKGHLDSPGFGI